MSDVVVEVRDLHQHFGDFHAVKGLSFDIHAGQVLGFIGENGAGKTTTMRIMTTLDLPSSGSVRVNGHHVVYNPSEVRKKTGWMPDHFGTYHNLTVFEYLDFFARAFGYRGQDRKNRIAEVMDFTELGPLANKLMNTLSKGMNQRLCLGRTLLHDPNVLILDEPAAGLDPKARVEFKRLIGILAEEGKCIFISSHILSELEEMCDDVLFVSEGELLHHGSAQGIKDMHDGVYLSVVINADREKLRDWAELQREVDFVEMIQGGAKLSLPNDKPETIQQLLHQLIQDGLPVLDFHREKVKLEDAFVRILQKKHENT